MYFLHLVNYTLENSSSDILSSLVIKLSTDQLGNYMQQTECQIGKSKYCLTLIPDLISKTYAHTWLQMGSKSINYVQHPQGYAGRMLNFHHKKTYICLARHIREIRVSTVYIDRACHLRNKG